MPYVILKKDGKPFNSHIVFTKTEIDRLADDGHEYIVLNTSTRQKSKVGVDLDAAHTRRRGGGVRPRPNPRVKPFDEFFNAYVETALWSSTDDDGEPLDQFDASDIDEATLDEMAKDAESFLEDNADDIGSDYAQAGHDFWLTRNRHGAGFWDGDWEGAKGSPRGSSGAAKRLTDSSHACGSYDLHYNDSDGKIYGGGG